MPIRNVGSETPTSDSASSICESQVFRRNAVYTPIAMPAITANDAAINESSSVAGSRSMISLETGCAWRRLRPNSPCSALPRNFAYCT